MSDELDHDAFEPGFGQYATGIIYPAFCQKIALDKMAAALLTSGDEHTIGPVFKRSHKIFNLQLARRRGTDDPDICRILKSGGT